MQGSCKLIAMCFATIVDAQPSFAVLDCKDTNK